MVFQFYKQMSSVEKKTIVAICGLTKLFVPIVFLQNTNVILTQKVLLYKTFCVKITMNYTSITVNIYTSNIYIYTLVFIYSLKSTYNKHCFTVYSAAVGFPDLTEKHQTIAFD